MNKENYTLSIVIPCYNEKNSIHTIVEKVLKAPIEKKEIIIVDDKSTDGTSEILDREGFENDPVLLPHFSCHILRHTFATRAAESGILAPKTLQSILGHADITTTFNIYVSCDESIKRIEISALDRYMETGERQGNQYKVNIETQGQDAEEERT